MLTHSHVMNFNNAMTTISTATIIHALWKKAKLPFNFSMALAQIANNQIHEVLIDKIKLSCYSCGRAIDPDLLPYGIGIEHQIDYAGAMLAFSCEDCTDLPDSKLLDRLSDYFDRSPNSTMRGLSNG